MFVDLAIALSMFMLSFIIVIVCDRFESPPVLNKIKDTTDTAWSTSGLDICLEIDSEFPLRTIEALRLKR
jgi:hypothetical protein